MPKIASNQITFCPNCDAENMAAAATCHACGHQLKRPLVIQAESERARATATEAPAAPLGVVAAAVAVLAGLALWVIGAGQGNAAMVIVGAWTASTAAFWLLTRAAILSALRQWNRERH